MSLCDRCQRPGRCCRYFYLNGAAWPREPEDRPLTYLEVLAELATIVPQGPYYTIGLPFLPLYRSPTRGWAFWCPNLLPNGRCGDYENRPQLCRDFAPASDKLCWHYDEETAFLLDEPMPMKEGSNDDEGEEQRGSA